MLGGNTPDRYTYYLSIRIYIVKRSSHIVTRRLKMKFLFIKLMFMDIAIEIIAHSLDLISERDYH